MGTTILTFALTALVLIMIPGPDQALITRGTLVGGRAAGLLTTLGGVAGLAVQALRSRSTRRWRCSS
jgi:threonine/homoserine/homoserine lactone efflux protein